MQLSSLFLITITIVLSIFSVDAVDLNTPSDKVCKKSKLTPGDGTQIREGSCSVTVQGEIPNVNNMPSTLIFFPPNGGTIQAGKTFVIKTKTINLATGKFSDPATQYNFLPQTLNGNGQIQGHSHITVQKFNGQVLDPTKFDFFLGLNNPADGQGFLNAEVKNGLPQGQYRVCTMVSSFTHQPVIMPVAQRGAQDDCVRFNVGKAGKKRRSLKMKHH